MSSTTPASILSAVGIDDCHIPLRANEFIGLIGFEAFHGLSSLANKSHIRITRRTTTKECRVQCMSPTGNPGIVLRNRMNVGYDGDGQVLFYDAGG